MDPLQVGNAVLVGAAGLALWADVRLAGRCPATVVKIMAHAMLASLAVRAGAALAPQLLEGGSRVRTVVALCAVVLPSWVYAFLVSLWTLKLIRSVLPE